MAGSKKKSDSKLSEELTRVLDELAGGAKASASVSEDDIQLAIRDIDVDSEELSDLYDALRAKGVEITSNESSGQEFSSGDDSEDDFDDDDVSSDEFDDEEGESESAAEAKAVKEALRSVPKAKTAKPKRSSRARARRQDTSTTHSPTALSTSVGYSFRSMVWTRAKNAVRDRIAV